MSAPVDTSRHRRRGRRLASIECRRCWAARDAAMKNVPLTVVHAVVTPTATWPPVPYPDSLAVRLEDEGKKAIMHAIKIAEEAMPADRKVTIKRELVYSTPAPALVEMSDEAEMIVVGSSGRGLLARGVLGSVSSTVVRHASCPVAVIHDEDLPDRSTLPSWWESTARRLLNSRRRSRSTKRLVAASI